MKLNRRDFIRYAGLSTAALAVPGISLNSCRSVQQTAGAKPNIILIVADDMGYGDAGCYGGTSLVPTPNIDRLAASGIRFTDGYVTAPVCGPCRYGLLTGAYQQRFGVQWNRDCWGRLPEDVLSKLGIEEETLEHNRIPSTQKIMNEPFQAAGYVTGIAGKWNLPCYPETTFDETFSAIHFGADYWPDENGHYTGVNESVPRSGTKRVGWGPERDGDEYLTDRLGRQTAEFIDRHAHEPFFFYLGFNAPHSPMMAKKSHFDAVSHLKTEALKLYGAMLIAMDENVGRILDALDENGIADNTIVAFVSDNGPTYAYNVKWPENWPKELLGSAGPLSGHKGQYLEGGIRVPFILRWPERLKGGQVYREPVSALDFYPTFCAAAGIPVPPGTELDGVNLIPYLEHEKNGVPHDMLFWYSYGNGAVRSGKWKLYVSNHDLWSSSNPDREKSRDEFITLFDLEKDMGETTDLSAAHPDIVDSLFHAYEAFHSKLPPPLHPNPAAK